MIPCTLFAKLLTMESFENKLILRTYVNMCMEEIKVPNTFLQKCK